MMLSEEMVPVLLFMCWIPAMVVHLRNIATSAGGPPQGYLQHLQQRVWYVFRVTVVVGLLILVTAFFDQVVGLGSEMGLVAGNAVLALGVAVWLAWRGGGSGGVGVGPAGPD